jgi:hypothetical protein
MSLTSRSRASRSRFANRTCIELVMNIVRYMMFFVFGMLLGLLLMPSLALWLRLNS